MRALATIFALLGGLMTSGPARADDECWVPMADWQPRDAVERMAEGQGWTVRRIKIDDGCYEVEGLDAEGRAVEVTVDPSTLVILKTGLEDDGDGRHRPDAEDGGEVGLPPEQAEPKDD